MKRLGINFLDSWIKDTSRKPLLLLGARQTGKTTLVRIFAESQKKRLIEINCEFEKNLVLDFETSLDPEFYFKQILFDKKTKIDFENDILFLDEIQVSPHLIMALRYFYEKTPQLPVIASGSLVEMTLANLPNSMPVGRVNFAYLAPMNFTEYLMATEEPKFAEFLETHQPQNQIPPSIHERLLRAFQEYIWVGGMPESVRVWAESRDPGKVARVKKEILNSYRKDFSKYRKKVPHERLLKVIQYASSNQDTKLKYSHIDREDRAKNLKDAIDLLSEAKLIAKIHSVHPPEMPLEANKDAEVYRLLFLDVGLKMQELEIGFQAWQRQKIEPAALGKIFEQAVGQSLYFSSHLADEPRLYYWLREGKANNAEVDFIFSLEQSVFPVEVKSKKLGSMRSLLEFAKHYGHKHKVAFRITDRFEETTRNWNGLGVDLYTVPFYLIGSAGFYKWLKEMD